MLKEIHEQPWAIRETVLGRVSVETGEVFLHEMNLDAKALRGVDRVVILACGTSWHAGLVGKFLIEELARLPVEVDYSSEFRYRHPIVDAKTLAVAITQSGETADTLGALREAKRLGARSIAICNVVGSMVTREAEGTVYTHAGPEIGVASTKAFTTQLVALHLLALALGQARGTLDPAAAKAMIREIDQLPIHIEATLHMNDAIAALAPTVQQHRDFCISGAASTTRSPRGRAEAQEISYIHAEGLPGR
jgi:glucosamine--fructose-6-phosphate aminotransferase (isomerizing)